MTAAANRAVPPIDTVAVGQLADRQFMSRLAAGVLTINAGVQLLVLAGVSIAAAVRGTDRPPLLLVSTMLVVLLAAMVGGALLVRRCPELSVRIGHSGIEIAAGDCRHLAPWDSVQRLWVRGSGSAWPLLCLSVANGRPATGGCWRIKASANRRLHGTPIAVPLATTGLSERALVPLVHGYAGRSGVVPADGAPVEVRTWLGYRLQLKAIIIAAAVAPVSWVWTAGILYAQGAPAEPLPAVVPAGSALLLAGSATVAVAWLGITCYRMVVGAGPYGRPAVLRLGPEGIAHIRGRRIQQLPWHQVRHVYLAAERSGEPVVCVTTEDPLALVPRELGWSGKVRRNQRRYGSAVAVPLSGAGLTGPALLAAVRHYAAGSAQPSGAPGRPPLAGQ